MFKTTFILWNYSERLRSGFPTLGFPTLTEFESRTPALNLNLKPTASLNFSPIRNGLSSPNSLQRAHQLNPVSRAAYAKFLHLIEGQLLGKLQVDAIVDEDGAEVVQVVNAQEVFNGGWLQGWCTH